MSEADKNRWGIQGKLIDCTVYTECLTQKQTWDTLYDAIKNMPINTTANLQARRTAITTIFQNCGIPPEAYKATFDHICEELEYTHPIRSDWAYGPNDLRW